MSNILTKEEYVEKVLSVDRIRAELQKMNKRHTDSCCDGFDVEETLQEFIDQGYDLYLKSQAENPSDPNKTPSEIVDENRKRGQEYMKCK